MRKRYESAEVRMPEVLGGGWTGESNPVWMRQYSFPGDLPPRHPHAQQMLDAALFSAGADRMVVGHTVQTKINSALGGKCWRIDVGASRGMMNGTPEVLQIKTEQGREVVSILTRNGPVPADGRTVGAMPKVALPTGVAPLDSAFSSVGESGDMYS